MTENGDPFDSPEFHEWAAHVLEDLVPKLTASSATISIVPDTTDVKFAVELGYSIMLDKPIIALVTPGRRLPPKLATIADAVIEGTLDTEEGRREVGEAIAEVMDALFDD